MSEQIALGPVRGKARIDVLDILRGLAILGIYFMNVPFEAAPTQPQFVDFRLLGWTPADQSAWIAVQLALEGTQRCMLEFLFGAGMMVLAARAMEPDGPVAIADLHLRRNIWLLAFGLFDIFVILWVGDILSIYALAALFLFSFRRMKPRALVAIGMTYALFTAAMGTAQYVERTTLIANVAVAHQHQAAHQPITAVDKKALADWQKKLDGRKVTPDIQKKIDAEVKAHHGGLMDYAQLYWSDWLDFFWAQGGLPISVLEAWCAMLIGIALWKWGIIQGDRSVGFYAGLAVAAYAVGVTIRWIGITEILTFQPIPKSIWITSEFGRLAMGLGHVALINLFVKVPFGRALLSPLRAAGRTAFSIYFLQQILSIHILFAPYGLNRWGQHGWADLALIAAVMWVGMLALANLWMRFFVTGPLEWLWRSLAYLRWQPMLRRDEPGDHAVSG
jgi:uncharacterized protein